MSDRGHHSNIGGSSYHGLILVHVPMSCLARASAPDVAVIRSGILYADCVQSVVSYIVVWCCGILARHQHYSVIRLLTFGKRLVCCVASVSCFCLYHLA